ncbi:GGDEF domain-containing protein [Candidatus Oleimmundimicrobium sp.]|uniref:GGDEF domain-containing protein n=1 Tax=Candidatus Oleimmundimicrobium sp. TaxID=3060597 RepID=UPI00271F57BB|nr:GGDEF domain-containing protein [Candidatus Oleimmundimicrobium sp.]MDO8886658.1 GGDEF domain-containing protein [Candidatus Oleimmundimicrobium sp.]
MNITERKKIEKKEEALTKKLKHQAQIDGLTGVYNRQHLDNELKIEIKRAKRYNRPLSLIMLDIDHFKEVNDRCGHQVGDWTLKKIAKSMKDVARATDFVGRYGGEEFIVVCTETAIDKALNLAKRMRKEIKKLRVLDKDGLLLKITASFGVAQYSESEDFDKLLANVDGALYEAKKEGRDRVYCAKD